MICNAEGRALIEKRYNRPIDEVLLADIEHILSQNLRGSPTTDNQFSAFCVCAYDLGISLFKTSAVFATHTYTDQSRKNAAWLWLTPFLTKQGNSENYRKEEQALYMQPDQLQEQAA